MRYSTIRLVGMTYVTGRVSWPDGKGAAATLRFIVDSGSLYSVVPEAVWKRLRLKSSRTVEFTFADGTVISRGVSECTFSLEGNAATSPVVPWASCSIPCPGSSCP